MSFAKAQTSFSFFSII